MAQVVLVYGDVQVLFDFRGPVKEFSCSTVLVFSRTVAKHRFGVEVVQMQLRWDHDCAYLHSIRAGQEPILLRILVGVDVRGHAFQ